MGPPGIHSVRTRKVQVGGILCIEASRTRVSTTISLEAGGPSMMDGTLRFVFCVSSERQPFAVLAAGDITLTNPDQKQRQVSYDH